MVPLSGSMVGSTARSAIALRAGQSGEKAPPAGVREARASSGPVHDPRGAIRGGDWPDAGRGSKRPRRGEGTARERTGWRIRARAYRAGQTTEKGPPRSATVSARRTDAGASGTV